jgi:gas vesicle protein
MNDRTSIFCFLAGGVTGAALALVLAPQSGDATRERIRRKLRDTTDSARDLTEQVVQRGEEMGDEAARRVQDAGSVLAGDRSRNGRGNGDEVAAT